MAVKELEYIVTKIKEADLVLIGLGEELDLVRQIKKMEKESTYSEEIRQFLPFIRKVKLDEKKEEYLDIYENLAQCVKNKNYFIVSLCQDEIIRDSGLNMDRIVTPCGGYDKLQCSEKCSNDLYDIPEDFMKCLKEELLHGERSAVLEAPRCPHCGKELVFNNVDAEKYVEEGYLEQWGTYKKWLQGTVNKNVCILELGAGMMYPTVIRW